MTYFSLLTRMQKKSLSSKSFPHDFQRSRLKTHFTKIQYFGSKANNPTVSSCFRLFETFCPYLIPSILPHHTTSPYFSTILPYNTSPQYFSTILPHHTSQPYFLTILPHNTSPPYFPTTLPHNTSPLYFPTILFHYTSPPYFQTILRNKNP